MFCRVGEYGGKGQDSISSSKKDVSTNPNSNKHNNALPSTDDANNVNNSAVDTVITINDDLQRQEGGEGDIDSKARSSTSPMPSWKGDTWAQKRSTSHDMLGISPLPGTSSSSARRATFHDVDSLARQSAQNPSSGQADALPPKPGAMGNDVTQAAGVAGPGGAGGSAASHSDAQAAQNKTGLYPNLSGLQQQQQDITIRKFYTTKKCLVSLTFHVYLNLHVIKLHVHVHGLPVCCVIRV